LVEKPLATDIADVQRVIDAAAASHIPLMCGFVERFNPAVRTARQLITDPLLHIVALRHSAPDPRNKSSAAFDLLIHDIDLSLSFAGNANLSKVMGGQVIAPGASRADVADCILKFDTGLMATLSASRLGQRKIRVLHLMTASTLYEVDLLRADVTVYQHVGHEMERGGYRAQTIVDIPFVRHAGEPLALELEHFVALSNGQIDPATDRASILPAHVAADAVNQS
jgi:predicted dehydrogenase